jgi:hypothetical protein
MDKKKELRFHRDIHLSLDIYTRNGSASEALPASHVL